MPSFEPNRTLGAAGAVFGVFAVLGCSSSEGSDGSRAGGDGGGGGTATAPDSGSPPPSGTGGFGGTPDAGGGATGGALGDSSTDGAGGTGPVRCVPPPPLAAGLHVSVDGTATGDGSEGAPWDLATALSQGSSVAPGTTIWLHGGVYAGSFSTNLQGTVDGPIVVRAIPGERVTLDGAGHGSAVLSAQGRHTWYWGFEITNSDTDNRVTTETGSSPSDIVRGDGVSISGASDGLRFINLVVHDTSQGISFWTSAVDSEIYGTVVYANGWDAPDRPHGHAIYAQNLDGTKRIEENILFNGFSYGVHAYTEGGSIQGFDYVGNVVFNTGTATPGPREGGSDFLHGGLQPAARISIRETFGWSRQRDRSVLRIGYSADNLDVSLVDNYVVGRTAFDAAWSSIAMQGNTFIGDVTGNVDTTSYPDNQYSSTDPTETAVFVRPNRYEEGRGHVVVYNWSADSSVSVDVSAVLEAGWAYEILHAQNLFAAPVATGVFDGSPISIDMTSLEPAQPVGLPGAIQSDEYTSPDFDVFVVRRVACERP